VRLGALFDDSTYHRDERDQYERCHQFHTFVLSTLGKAAAQLQTYIFRLIRATGIDGAYTHLDRHSVMRVTCLWSTLLQRGLCNYPEAVRELRKAFIATVLRENNGNQSKAARELGMHRNTLSRTVSALGLDVRALRPGSRRPPGREPSLSAVRNMSR